MDFTFESKAFYLIYISIEFGCLNLYLSYILMNMRTCLKIILNLIFNVFFRLIYIIDILNNGEKERISLIINRLTTVYI